jgi:glycosyltransferase involved in cell wall biosynthesis
MKKVAIIDPASFTLPYDYFYIVELSKHYKVDFYFSKTKYNYEYIEKLKSFKNVSLKEYKVSSSIASRIYGLLNYIKMLLTILFRNKKYINIHFMWNIFFPIELPFFLILRKKMVFTFHNDVPHSYKGKKYWPYKLISKIANKIIFVSNYTKDNFLSKYGRLKCFYLLEHGLLPIIDVNSTIYAHTNVKDEIIFWGRVEDYKGVDIFIEKLRDYKIKIYGKWNHNLKNIKRKLMSLNNIEINDDYLDIEELSDLLTSEAVFILPYKKATQSGVLYTLLAYEKVFVSSDVGENGRFLRDNGLEKLIFNRDDESSINRAIRYAKSHYWDIKLKLKYIKNKYEWKNIMKYEQVKEIYE